MYTDAGVLKQWFHMHRPAGEPARGGKVQASGFLPQNPL